MKKNLRKNILIATIIIGFAFSGKSYADTGIVNANSLNLRAKATTNSKIIKTLRNGEKLEIISNEGDWIKVKSGNSEGYVNNKYIKIEKEKIEDNKENKNEEKENINENKVIKIEKETEIKILPLINSNTLNILKTGDEVIEITRTNKWIFVEKGNITGWILIPNKVKDNEINNDSKKENNEDNKENENVEQENIDVEKEVEQEELNQNDKTNSKHEIIYDKVQTKYVKESSIYVRSKPTTESDKVTILIKNTDVKILGEENGWYKIEFENFKGYIRKDLLSDSKIQNTNRSNVKRVNNIGNEIVKYAMDYLNKPYVYGGSGPNSFDCSGFTMYVYKNFGFNLSHSAQAQSKLGKEVKKDELELGDLVFFLDYKTMDEIAHCGIYIGEGNFIHASSGTGNCVKISNLLNGSYSKRYVKAVRLI